MPSIGARSRAEATQQRLIVRSFQTTKSVYTGIERRSLDQGKSPMTMCMARELLQMAGEMANAS
jgi:hypothetical protein